MGFINSLLTEEEVKKFKALNVSFGKKRISIDDGIFISKFKEAGNKECIKEQK